MRKHLQKKTLGERQKKKFYFRIFLISLITLLILPYNIVRLTTSPLSPLSVPTASSIYLPAPLQLPTVITNVLGTQIIEPTDVVKYINIERVKVGSPTLRMSPKLMDAAKKRADIILKYQNFSHQDPFENIELVTVLPKVGYYYRYATENIGMGGISAEDFVGGFMNSISHRENLLNTYLSDTGVAVVTGPYKQYFVNIAVQLFAIPGSEEDYLGYTKEETERYKTHLDTIGAKLNPVVWTVNKLLHPQDYSDKNYQKLSRQKEILSSIYARMKMKQPLQNDDVALIMEFNRNL